MKLQRKRIEKKIDMKNENIIKKATTTKLTNDVKALVAAKQSVFSTLKVISLELIDIDAVKAAVVEDVKLAAKTSKIILDFKGTILEDIMPNVAKETEAKGDKPASTEENATTGQLERDITTIPKGHPDFARLSQIRHELVEAIVAGGPARDTAKTELRKVWQTLGFELVLTNADNKRPKGIEGLKTDADKATARAAMAIIEAHIGTAAKREVGARLARAIAVEMTELGKAKGE